MFPGRAGLDCSRLTSRLSSRPEVNLRSEGWLAGGRRPGYESVTGCLVSTSLISPDKYYVVVLAGTGGGGGGGTAVVFVFSVSYLLIIG